MKRQEKQVKGPWYVTPGTVAVKVYKGETRGYPCYTICHDGPTGRQRTTKADPEEAKAEAQRIAGKIATGQFAVLKLTAEDQKSYVAAMDELRSTGTPLHDAVRQYVAAMKVLPDGTSLLAAVTDYAKRHAGDGAKRPVPEIVEAFIAASEAAMTKGKLSRRYVQSMRSHLRRFAFRFHTGIGNVLAKDIKSWLSDVTVSSKSTNNLRGSVITLFKYAKEQGYLSADVPTEADRTKRTKGEDSDIGILTPAQMQTLLDAAVKEGNEEAILYFALGGFGGLRSAELVRLQWSHLDLLMGRIKLDKSVTKTKTKRNFAMTPNLSKWLADAVKDKTTTGPVFSSMKATVRVIAFAKAHGVSWPANALRHSFCSYRAAATKSHAQVAMEAGNSIGMVRKHYDSVVGDEEAEAWFSITPPTPRP